MENPRKKQNGQCRTILHRCLEIDWKIL